MSYKYLHCQYHEKAIKIAPSNHTLLYSTADNSMAKEKLTNDKKRDVALDLYLNTDMSQKDICEIVSWTEKTFSSNKEKHNWEKLKGASTITAANIIGKLYLKLEAIVDADKMDADALSKVSKAIEMLSNKKVTLSHHINCGKEFTTWAFGINPELAKQINKLQMQFITERASNA